MSNKSFFWDYLDRRLGPSPTPVWELALGDEFPLIRPWLTPSPKLATVVSCERTRQTGCDYRIVPNEDGSFVGICDEDRCPRRAFDRADLICYEIQNRRLMKEAGRLVGLETNIAPLEPPGVSLFLAHLPQNPAVQILFTRQSNPQDFSRFVEHQILAGRAPFILLSPTLRHLTPDAAAHLQRTDCRVMALADGVEPALRGLRATNTFLAAWNELCAFYSPGECPSSLPMVDPSSPPSNYALICEGATWRFHFRGNTFTVKRSVGLESLAHLLQHWQHAFNPLEVKGRSDPRALSQPIGPGESLEAEGSIETASAYSLLKVKKRLQQLNQEAAESEGHEVALNEIAEERERVEQELVRIMAPGGRVRREGGTMDKARKAVSNNIRRQLAAIHEASPTCARHLAQRLSLGFSMTYTPDVGEEWIVKFLPKK